MLRFFFLICVLAGGFHFYKHGNPFSQASVVDKDGKPLVVLFTGPNCNEQCEQLRTTLSARKIAFEEVDLAGSDTSKARKFDLHSYPTIMIGKRKVIGGGERLVSALVEEFGSEILTRSEKMAMSNHFDAQGRPKVVLYGTRWCGYCAKQRDMFAAQQIPFDDIDVEASERGMLAYRALKGSGYPLTYVGFNRFEGFSEDGALLAAASDAAKAR